jgi:hypothetical protein
MYRWLLALVLTVAVAAPVAVSAARKNALPPTPCTVQPRTEAEVATLVAAATPGGEEGRDPDGWADSPADLPQGDPADPETVAAVTAAAREFAGCLNAGDLPRWLALMTDRLLPEAVASFGMAALFETTGTPVPGENPELKIVTMRVADVRVLPDSRVGAVVVWKVRQAPGEKPAPEANFHIFQRVGDHWLLDEEIRGYVEEEPGAASSSEAGAPTPVPVAVEEVAPVFEAVPAAVEIDRVVYVEPTKAGAKFSIEAIVLGPIVGDDAGRDATCSRFAFERGTRGTTVSAQCRAAEGMIGREAILAVHAYNRGRGVVNVCEDTVPLAAEMVLSCTVEDPVPAS